MPAAFQVVDLHVDTPTEYVKRGPFSIRTGLANGQVSIERLRAGGYAAQVFVVWAPPNEPDWPAFAERDYAAVQTFVADSGDSLVAARTPEQVRAAASVGKIAALLAMEGAHPLGDDPGAMVPWADRGLVYLGLTWNNSNAFADAALDETPRHGGLSAAGRALVRLCNERGVAVDVSHAAPSTFWQVYEASAQPFIASHSDVRALSPHPRNLDDEQLSALARAGGVVGVNYHAEFLSSKPEGEVTVADAADVVDHLVRTAGIDHVALGSDFDGGIRVPRGLEDAAAVPGLFAELRRRGYDEGALAKIAGENALRALGEIQGRHGRRDRR